MAGIKISALPSATIPLTGTEVLPIVQSGTTVQASVTSVNNLVTLVGLGERTSATGSFKAPAGTTAERDSVPSFGYARANTTLTKMEWWNGTAWVAMGGGATGGGNDTVFNLNSQTVTTSYSIPSGQNANSVGPISVASGVVVTIPSGSRWAVL